jgi:hypothetical protein
MLVICTPGLAKDLSRQGQPDWVYTELRWWVAERGSAPIVVDASGEGDRWLPEMITDKWPDINRIALSAKDAESARRSNDHSYDIRIRDRIVGAVRELEQQTLFEDLARSRQQQRWLRLALCIATVLFLLTAALGWLFDQRRRDAIQQAQIAEDRRMLAVEILADSLGRDGFTSERYLIQLAEEAVFKKGDKEFLIVALDALNCFGPGSVDWLSEFLTFLDSIEDSEVITRVQALRENEEAVRAGNPRPHPCRRRNPSTR